jgi:arylsulfatase A-like enzyme
LLDLMPTFSAIAGVPLPDDRAIDGGDISGVLIAGNEDTARAFYYMSSMSTEVVAYRDGDWKIKLPRSGYPALLEPILKLDRYSHDTMLFNLKDDPFEQTNLAGQYPERVAQLQQDIADIQHDIDGESARELYMSSAKADKKGYGPLIVKASLLSVATLLLVLGLLYGLYRLIKSKISLRPQRGTH